MTNRTKNYLFWGGAFAIMLGIVVALSTMMSVYSSRQMVSIEVSGLNHFVGYIAENNISGISLIPPYNTLQEEILSYLFREVRRDSEIEAVRIWLHDGYITVNSNGAISFTEEELPEKALTAFESRRKAAYRFYVPGESDEWPPSTMNEKNGRRKRLDVFVPLHSEFSDRTNAVVEIVKDSSVVLAPLKRVQTMIWLIAFLGLGLYPALMIYANMKYRKQKEEELEIIKAKQLEAVKSMVVTFNHEVNQPLTGICAYADLLKKAVKDDANALRYADRINEQAVRLSELVKDVRDITSIETVEYIQGTQMIDLKKSTDRNPRPSSDASSKSE